MERCSHPGAHREAIKPAMQRSHVGPKSNAHATRVAFLFDRPDLTAPYKYRRHLRKLLPSAHHTHEAKRISEHSQRLYKSAAATAAKAPRSNRSSITRYVIEPLPIHLFTSHHTGRRKLAELADNTKPQIMTQRSKAPSYQCHLSGYSPRAN